MPYLYRTLPEDAAENWLRDSQSLTGMLNEEHGYHLLTRNRRDFADIPGLDLQVMEYTG